jgi:tricorn protease-like protein
MKKKIKTHYPFYFLLLVIIIFSTILTGCTDSGITSMPTTSKSSSSTTTSMPKTTPKPTPTPTPMPSTTTTYLSPVQREIQKEGLIGNKLLFIVLPDFGKPPSLYMMNIDGTNVTKLLEGVFTTDINEVCWYFSLSPDKKHIAYSNAATINGSVSIQLNIYDLNDGSITKVSEVAGYYNAWSPDGTKIAYVNRTGDLFVVNVDGTNNTELTSARSQTYLQSGTIHGHIQHPVWSPHGKYIMYDDFNAPGSMTIGIYTLDYRSVYLLNLETGEKKTIYHGAEIVNTTTSETRVLIHSDDNCYDVNRDGTGIRELNLDFNDKMQYHPNGEVIGYFSYGDPIRLLNPATGSITSSSTIDVENFIWSPDGRHIAYVKNEYFRTSNICIMRSDNFSDFSIYIQENADIFLVGWIDK